MRLDRIYEVHKLLKTSLYPVPMKRFQETLGRSSGKENVSRDTVERIFTDLRERYHAPIEYSRKDDRPNGYYYTDNSYELPGLWFSADQLAGLLILEQALEQMQAGFLAEYLKQFKGVIKQLLGKNNSEMGTIEGCIKLLHYGQRKNQYKHFSTVALALLRSQRLKINYYTRGRDKHTDREISPQRLILYRDNWYLDAYCHESKALRTFSIDCIETAEILNTPIQVLDEKLLDEFMNKTYGIFYQELSDWAVLRFSQTQARWVKNEIWHPNQKSKFLNDGRYELQVPFGETTELIRDILKYGSEVK